MRQAQEVPVAPTGPMAPLESGLDAVTLWCASSQSEIGSAITPQANSVLLTVS